MTTDPHRRPADARRRSVRVVRVVLGWTAVIALVILLWPQRFGGHLGITQVSGHSMNGTYASGDLLLSWRHDAYAVGDVIVYHPPGVDTSLSVVHRIVEEPEPGSYLTRGDNKTDLDPWQPVPADVHGSVFLRIPTGELPGLGNVRGLTLILLVAFLAAWAAAAFVMSFGRDDDPDDSDDSDGSDANTSDDSDEVAEARVPQAAGAR